MREREQGHGRERQNELAGNEHQRANVQPRHAGHPGHQEVIADVIVRSHGQPNAASGDGSFRPFQILPYESVVRGGVKILGEQKIFEEGKAHRVQGRSLRRPGIPLRQHPGVTDGLDAWQDAST